MATPAGQAHECLGVMVIIRILPCLKPLQCPIRPLRRVRIYYSFKNNISAYRLPSPGTYAYLNQVRVGGGGEASGSRVRGLMHWRSMTAGEDAGAREAAYGILLRQQFIPYASDSDDKARP